MKKKKNGKNVHRLPVHYAANSSGWMTGALFVEWLDEWDRTLGKRGRIFCCLWTTVQPMTWKTQHWETSDSSVCQNTPSILRPSEQGIIRTEQNTKLTFANRWLAPHCAKLMRGRELLLQALQRKLASSMLCLCYEVWAVDRKWWQHSGVTARHGWGHHLGGTRVLWCRYQCCAQWGGGVVGGGRWGLRRGDHFPIQTWDEECSSHFKD